ncbi:HlyD family secretion protein [Bdellovibrio reynosensis]|uniref:Biotin/lipoyl-binding protein n=1 Tax=Bdellovibrio reynosensis TaxID=2835041 RepID=A0ABY4C7L6_9BACT|nr:biotin/lipoyl-binding protein [Bdellovibrio reynosensis]UOF00981.1 biotin/lipoyl-binding protein [Bdellovibrio reynosensis]
MKTLKSLIHSFFFDVVGADNKFLFFFWSGAVIAVLSLGLYLGTEPVSILGVAESREYQVNFSNPVEIKRVHVQQNQVVKKGDLLIELSQADLDMQLRVLKSRMDRLLAEYKLRQEISLLTKDVTRLPAGSDPLQVDIIDTKREIEVIERRMRNLFVFAEVEGSVGTVNFKDGEKAPSFATLLTLVPLNPSYVNGYVNENLQSMVEVGQTVNVYSSSGLTVQGKVTSVGARIVPIPERLLRIQTLPAWGREVVVKIPDENKFLLGEKVTVRKSWGISLFSTAQAEADTGIEIQHKPVQDITFPPSVREEFIPEISGVAYLPEIHQFALVSDDYPGDVPHLLLMNSRGEVTEQMLPILNLDKMEDIESISQQGSDIYLLSSLSGTKKNKLKKTRQLFVKVQRSGLTFTAERKIDLRLALLEASKKSKDVVLNKLYAAAQGTQESDLEVEGHAVKGNELFLLLKRPQFSNNEGVILKIKNLEDLLETGKIANGDLSVAVQFTASAGTDHSGAYHSDMIFAEDTIFISSSCREEKCSAIWRLKPGETKAELVEEFKTKGLEGLTIYPPTGELFGVFDQKKGSKFISLAMPDSLRVE